jgi:hypothetical protein
VVEWMGSGEDDGEVSELEDEATGEEESEDPVVDGVLKDEEGGAGIWGVHSGGCMDGGGRCSCLGSRGRCGG